MTWWQLYLLTRLDPFSTAFGVLSILLFICIGIATAIMLLAIGDRDLDIGSEECKKFKWFIIRGSVLASLLLTISMLLPSNKDIALIYAGSLISKSEEIQKLPENAVKVLNTYMEQYIKKEDKPK